VPACPVSASGSSELREGQTQISPSCTTDLLPLTTFPSQRSPSTPTRHQYQQLNPASNISSTMDFSPCLHQDNASSRQIRPALMLARRSQRSPRPSSPLMTPNLASLGHTPSPSRFPATSERTMNAHRASTSPTTTRNTEPLGWQFHFTAHPPQNRAQIRQAGAWHDCQFKQFICLVSPSYWSKPMLPRFVNKTFFCLLV
jgi:hypothetical protein